jgi:hypothetical protein
MAIQRRRAHTMRLPRARILHTMATLGSSYGAVRWPDARLNAADVKPQRHTSDDELQGCLMPLYLGLGL